MQSTYEPNPRDESNENVNISGKLNVIKRLAQLGIGDPLVLGELNVRFNMNVAKIKTIVFNSN